jgi:hypothetical protein
MGQSFGSSTGAADIQNEVRSDWSGLMQHVHHQRFVAAVLQPSINPHRRRNARFRTQPRFLVGNIMDAQRLFK